MNKTLLLIITVCCLAEWSSKAATVSGTLTNATLSAPAASQKVYLLDSVTSVATVFLDSTFTNSSGNYSFTVPGTITKGLFRLMTINGSKMLQLTSITGALISSQEISRDDLASIDVTTLPAGMYMLRIATVEGTASYKVVK